MTGFIPTCRLALGLGALLSFAQAQPAPLISSFNVQAYGARGDGVTDDTAAINKAIAAAQAVGGRVYLPAATKSYLYSSCIYIKGIAVYGDGDRSLLQAADPRNSGIAVCGEHASLAQVKIISPLSRKVGRQSTPQSAGVVIYQASDFTVENVDVDTTASVGIMSLEGKGEPGAHSAIRHCRISNTLADGIHLTDKSCYIDVSDNTVTNSGDDMFAVVSYEHDGGICHDINITGNSGEGQSANGRGISVVGGNAIRISKNNIQKSRGAGIYLQSELIRNLFGLLVYKTYGDDDITVEDNVLKDVASVVRHGGINLGGRPADTSDRGQSETQDASITHVIISGNTITNCHQSGITLQAYFDHVSLENNTINTTADQGIDVIGGSNLSIGDSGGNTFKNIGRYGIHLGNASFTPFTSGTILIQNNVFWSAHVNGEHPLPVIFIGARTINGQVSGNQFHANGNPAVSMPYVRYGVE